MSELVVFKANELAVSRYDLTEHETKLILFGVSKLNPTLEPTQENRTVTFSIAEYASLMGMSYELAWGNLSNATRRLMNRSVEIIYPTGDIAFRIFNWADYVEFNRKTQTATIEFSSRIIPYLFELKKFIKYNLEHVKAFENKYSMRVYEWLLKELTQRKTHKANIEIGITEFKFMMMLENKYADLRNLTRKVLTLVEKDLNTYSNMRLAIEKRGRPADTLIFQVELDKQIDLVTELEKDPTPPPEKTHSNTVRNQEKKPNDRLIDGVKKTLLQASEAKIQLTGFEAKFLADMQSKHDLNGSFDWLTAKQKITLEKILSKYGNI